MQIRSQIAFACFSQEASYEGLIPGELMSHGKEGKLAQQLWHAFQSFKSETFFTWHSQPTDVNKIISISGVQGQDNQQMICQASICGPECIPQYFTAKELGFLNKEDSDFDIKSNAFIKSNVWPFQIVVFSFKDISPDEIVHLLSRDFNIRQHAFSRPLDDSYFKDINFPQSKGKHKSNGPSATHRAFVETKVASEKLMPPNFTILSVKDLAPFLARIDFYPWFQNGGEIPAKFQIKPLKSISGSELAFVLAAKGKAKKMLISPLLKSVLIGGASGLGVAGIAALALLVIIMSGIPLAIPIYLFLAGLAGKLGAFTIPAIIASIVGLGLIGSFVGFLATSFKPPINNACQPKRLSQSSQSMAIMRFREKLAAMNVKTQDDLLPIKEKIDTYCKNNGDTSVKQAYDQVAAFFYNPEMELDERSLDAAVEKIEVIIPMINGKQSPKH